MNFKSVLLLAFLLLWPFIILEAVQTIDQAEKSYVLDDLCIKFPSHTGGVLTTPPDSKGGTPYGGGSFEEEKAYQPAELTGSFSLTDQALKTPLSLYLGPTNSPYEVYLNGALLYRWGSLPPRPVTVNFCSTALPLPADRLTAAGENEIALRFYVADTTPFPPLIISSTKNVARWVFWRNMAGVYLIRGAVFTGILLAFYFFLLFFGGKQVKHLWFSLFSLAFTLAYWEISLSFEAAPELLIKIMSKNGFILAVTFLTLFVLDFIGTGKRAKPGRFLIGAASLSLILLNSMQPDKQGVDALLGLVMPFYLGPLLIVNSFLVGRTAVKRRNRESIILSAAFVAVIGASFYDIAHIMAGKIPYAYLTAYGFVVLVISIFIILTLEQQKISRQNAAWAEETEKSSAVIHQMLREVTAVAEGLSETGRELEVQLDRSDRSVSNSMESAVTLGTRIVNRLTDVEGTITSAASRLEDSSKKIPGALGGLSSFSETLTSSVSSIQEHLGEVLGGASATGASADQFSSIAREGADIVVRTSTAMDRISQNSLFLEELLLAVEDIAGRMNILSINASIEAARAGSFGAGFAVVAQEVRQLAAQANRQLSSSFDQIAEMRQAVEAGAELSETLSASLGDILREAEETARRIKGMLARLEEQEGQIAKLMAAALNMAHDIKAVQELADTSQEENSRLTAAIGGVSSTLQEVGDLLQRQQRDAGELRDAVGEVDSLGRRNIEFVDSLRKAVVENR